MNKPFSASGTKASVLFLSPEAPYPTIGGGPLRSASLLEYLAQSFSVHAIVFREPGSPNPSRAIPPGRIDRLDVLNLPHHFKHPAARAIRNSLRLIRARPPLVDRFSGFASAIAGRLRDQAYAAAVVEHFWCAPYVEQLRPHAKRVILDLHNIESAWHDSLAAHESVVRAFALRRFAAAARGLEQQWLRKFDTILVPSDEEAERVCKIVPGANVVVYPNALPEVAAPQRAECDEIVFSGNLEYPPNIAAIRFFHDRVWPSLRGRPGLRWRIIGKNPEAIRRKIGDDPQIVVTGFVDDAVSALAISKVAVVPVLSGSGTRFKILEAWAAGTAVVSTALGAEGLKSRDGEHLLLANTPEDFAAAVSRLLDSPHERARIGCAGRKLYEQSYTWEVAWGKLEGVFGNASLGR
jgi:glycosyltransferase involved in cell wall biosynthesis